MRDLPPEYWAASRAERNAREAAAAIRQSLEESDRELSAFYGGMSLKGLTHDQKICLMKVMCTGDQRTF
jgi:hypothetical protein